MTKELRLACAVAAVGMLVATSISYGQDKLVRIRGAIEKVDGQNLEVKSRDGKNVKARMSDKVRFTAMVKASLEDLTPDTYIGVTAMPQADGSQKAIRVMIFADVQRGTGEGHRPWVQPGSTMTNATVDTTVGSVDGQVVMVKYKDGEKKVIIPPSLPIPAYVVGERSELKPGAAISIVSALKKPDGTLEASRVNVGRDGIVPN